jgi:3-hydroxyacyl-[acyl-carrier-protein] dehydratase
MPPELHFDPEKVDFSRVIADRKAIGKINPQRYEFEQLDGILVFDREKALCVGYKDVRKDEFWARGHLPGYPLLPGVLMCEAAAQLCGYYIGAIGVEHGDFIGFGGMDNVRFRQPVNPGDRLVLVSKCLKYNRRQTSFSVQGFVEAKMVFNADIIGVPMTYPEGVKPPSSEA